MNTRRWVAMGEHLSNRLAVLEADVIGAVRLAPAAEIRAWGDRRRWPLRALASVAAVLTASGLLAGGLGLLSAGGGGGRGEQGTSFPATLVMPHDAEKGWGRSNEVATESRFNPCDEADVTLAGRVDARTMIGAAFPEDPDPVMLTEQLLLYPDE